MFADFDPIIALTIFLAYTTIDGLYTVYTLAIVNKSKLTAANVGLIMYLLMGIGTFNYVSNWVYIIPMACGGWVGTYLSLVLAEKLEARKATISNPEEV